MKKTLRKSIAIAMSFWIGFYPLRGAAEDIDIFVGSSAGSSDNPNVLIVLDNTSNWARQNQKWPDGASQGQSEVSAIKQVVADLNSDINVGLFEFVTEGNANDNGGKVRFAVSPMNATNKSTMTTTLNTIYGDINGVLEKRNSGTEYGNLMYDIYNYFAGANALYPSAVTGASRVDANGYTSAYSTFKTPLSSANSCAKNYVIFVSNPNASGPTSDTAANTAALAALGGNTTQLALPNFTTSTTTQTTAIGNSSGCYATQAACTAASGGYASVCGADKTYSSCSCSAAVVEAGACAAGTQKYMVKATIAANGQRNLGLTGDCYSNTNSCPANNDHTWDTQCSTSTGVTDGSGNAISVSGLTCSCNTSTTTTTNCTGTKKHFTVAQSIPGTVTANLGYTSACYASAAACSTADYSAKCTTLGGWGGACACDSSNTTTGTSSCNVGESKYTVSGTSTVTVNTATGTSTVDTNPFNADEWARFMYQTGVPVSGATVKQSISTYTIDVYNAQPNAKHTSLMISMAKAGGGKYFTATNESALVTALKQIFAEIESVNSTFASASLPVNATNRAQNENQVFIGMFRPDPEAKPRWFGNLKRYQLILGSDGTTVELGDKDGQAAVNNNTGFITDCATSWWTSDSGTYWLQYSVSPPAAGTCTTTSYNTHSDAPDGPRVEKGAVAEVIRKGNNPTATDGAPTYSVNRTIYGTENNTSTTLAALSGLSTLDTDTKNWVLGYDVGYPVTNLDENSGALKQDNTGTLNTTDISRQYTETRATIHGDVIHSRPLPINYGTSVVVYYGANDGMLRAVDADTGKELWGFVPYEFHSRLERLRTNSPLVSYPNVVALGLPSQAKDYFWDGSVGILQNADNSKVWIYPTMRRGGRMIYAMDVTTATSPTIKWKAGCPNLANDTDCTAGMSGIGQTWSIPNIAPVKGYSTTDYLLFLGGGYDTCEDADTASPSCGSPKGAGVYVLKADDGSVVKSLSTTRSVASDVSVIDINGDGYADYAYVLDTGGNLYRISMVSRTVAGDGSVTYATLAPGAWTIHRVAYTNGSGQGRKFLFSPALLGTTPSLGKVYVAMGTGDREHPLSTNYPFGSVTNRFYVFLDDLASTAATNLDDTSVMNNVTVDPGCDVGSVLPSGSTKGWFMDLNQYGTGEQTVTSSLIVGGMVTFSTNRPIQAAAGTCSTVLGEARGYWVNLFNGSGAIGVSGSCGGSRSGVMVGGGLPPSPVIGTVPVGGKVTTVVLGAAQKGGGANTPISPQKTKPTISSTRKRVYLYSTGDN